MDYPKFYDTQFRAATFKILAKTILSSAGRFFARLLDLCDDSQIIAVLMVTEIYLEWYQNSYDYRYFLLFEFLDYKGYYKPKARLPGLGLPRYTRIVTAPQIAAMQIVFEYAHLYIRIQTNIHKNEMPYLFAALEIDVITSKQQR